MPPALAVSTVSSLRSDSAIALGNVVGSNIFNVLLILGLSAVIVPLSVSSQLFRLDVPIMIGVSTLAWLAAVDGTVELWEGAAMLIGFLAYTGWLIRAGRKETRENSKARENSDLQVSALLRRCSAEHRMAIGDYDRGLVRRWRGLAEFGGRFRGRGCDRCQHTMAGAIGSDGGSLRVCFDLDRSDNQQRGGSVDVSFLPVTGQIV